MARLTNSIRLMDGDEPTVEYFGGRTFLTFDGHPDHGEICATGTRTLRLVLESALSQVDAIETRIREYAADDDAADALVYGEEPAA